MKLNEIASWLHKEYDIPYRKALSIAAQLIKEGAFNEPREEVEEKAKSLAGVREIEWDGTIEDGDSDNPFGSDTIPEDESTGKLQEWFNAVGSTYLGEAGILGMMAGALREVLVIAREGNTDEEIVRKLKEKGYNDDYFNGLFEPSDGTWTYRDERGRVKLKEWLADIKGIMKTLDIKTTESLYYMSLSRMV